MKTAKANPVVTSFGTLEDIVNPEMEAILTGQKPAAKALAEAARKVEKKLLDKLGPKKAQTSAAEAAP